MLICCIPLLCDWWFHLCHRIDYICYFVASYLFLLWYDWFLRRCFELLFGEILFLSESFLFLATSRFSRVRCCLLVVYNGHIVFFFSFLFPSYYHSVVHCVVSIISDGCNQSSFVFFYAVFESLYRCINAVFNADKSLPPSFLDTYSLSTSSLGCNDLCMVISFLVFWSVCLSSSLVHLRKGPEYLTKVTARVFILLIRFRLESFVSSSFLIFLRYSFWILSFISSCLMVSASKMLKYMLVSFSPSVAPVLTGSFYWTLSDSKFSQCFGILVSIRTDFRSA